MKINKYSNNPDYISLSKINGSLKKEYPMFKDIPLNEIKEMFYKCELKQDISGNPYNKKQQRHVLYVKKEELAQKVFRENFRLPRK